MLELTTIYFIASLVLFLVGIGGGYIIAIGKTDISKPRLRTAVAIVVTIVWIISIGAEIIIPAYTVSVLVHGIMGAVVGYLFSDDGLTFNIGGD